MTDKHQPLRGSSRRDLLRWSAGASLLAFLPAARAAPTIYRDPRAPIDLRVRDLMARMTLDEKVAQMIALWGTKAEVMAQSPSLADKVARNTAEYTVEEIAEEIARRVRPDVFGESVEDVAVLD